MDSKHIISPQDAQDLLNKLLHEKIPLHSHLRSTTGSVVVLSGFLEKGEDGSLCIAAAGPRIPGANFLVVPMEDRNYQFAYMEQRAMPKELQEQIGPVGENLRLRRGRGLDIRWCQSRHSCRLLLSTASSSAATLPVEVRILAGSQVGSVWCEPT